MSSPENPEVLRPLDDTQAEIERIFLWDAVKKAFQDHAHTAGLQSFFDRSSESTMFVLVEPAPDKPEEGDAQCDLRLWGEWQPGQGVRYATITYSSAQTGQELWTYHVSEAGMDQYTAPGIEPTALDQDDVGGIRSHVSTATWSPEASEACAANVLYWA